eukprot:TRINITY_DN23257_c0_g2_i1.p1 TRINITY_DN23257_c0_g2~~TRINITY_DN23257_c0_g2_i1.p1  ORF type:complete len:207 (+),score=5.52 TRINITY_DN23257_c0_g2_i1:366-986(+)
MLPVGGGTAAITINASSVIMGNPIVNSSLSKFTNDIPSSSTASINIRRRRSISVSYDGGGGVMGGAARFDVSKPVSILGSDISTPAQHPTSTQLFGMMGGSSWSAIHPLQQRFGLEDSTSPECKPITVDSHTSTTEQRHLTRLNLGSGNTERTKVVVEGGVGYNQTRTPRLRTLQLPSMFGGGVGGIMEGNIMMASLGSMLSLIHI